MSTSEYCSLGGGSWGHLDGWVFVQWVQSDTGCRTFATMEETDRSTIAIQHHVDTGPITPKIYSTYRSSVIPVLHCRYAFINSSPCRIDVVLSQVQLNHFLQYTFFSWPEDMAALQRITFFLIVIYALLSVNASPILGTVQVGQQPLRRMSLFLSIPTTYSATWLVQKSIFLQRRLVHQGRSHSNFYLSCSDLSPGQLANGENAQIYPPRIHSTTFAS